MQYRKDEEVHSIIQQEAQRQEMNIELIASENIVSPAVLEAVGSILTNKYAEGYPRARYYGGCEIVDKVEDLAINRAKKLFDAAYANVQPHSGSQANMAVYMAALKPYDTILGMDLNAGGHLTHGAPVNFSGKIYNAVSYGVDPDSERLNYDHIMQLAQEHKPKMIVAGASAYARIIDFERFSEIAKSVGAYLLVDMAHIAGMVATGHHPTPLPYADFVTSTTHKTLRGPRGGLILMGKDVENNLGILAPKSGRVKMFSEILDSSIFPTSQGGPLMHVIAGKAVAFGEALHPSFSLYQEQVIKNAQQLAQSLTEQGLRIVSGGTDNHIVLVDLRSLNLSGHQAEVLLDKVHITCNKNSIPFDPAPARETSGIRLGTPVLTTRGMKEVDMQEVAQLIVETLRSDGNEQKIAMIKQKSLELTQRYPLDSIRFK
ncbi:serine hydroxymethyltransferase [Entomospira entomophila]|uniref:Serine hydroxymethyltransferase n=1 Tax=Entomospira entomophila TaxID=2719988 RepID=A0A968G9J9_9SPIO|nr:serine hydroxymethyltransferase [Entomospira entomophilus]NIZ41103.1 serine hydroxymethyltransferase [Entomospira entomophilus]WDI35311.1 serine hydroxymethyltransferase [Entomospira entomophilus]